jgi:sulfonate transport system ATP-binding protein
MSAAIEVEHVVKRFHRDVVLQDLSLRVRPSEIACLIGPSGCGKSTLLRLISGLERDHAGRLTIDGREVMGPSRAVGFMFQEPRLMPWLTVRENIALGLAPDQRRHADERIATLLAQVQLENAAHALPRALSGGMAQRVALARALAAEPGVLLLDEPFSAVDALTRMSRQEPILTIWQRTRITMLLVTHDLDEALYLSDSIFVMSGKPAVLREVVTVDVERPRDRRDSAFARLRIHLMDALHVSGAQPSTDRGISR